MKLYNFVEINQFLETCDYEVFISDFDSSR